MSNEKLGAEQGRVKRGTFAEIAANALGAAEMLNGPVVDATRVIEKVIQEVGPQIYAMAARAEQAYHARGAGRERPNELYHLICDAMKAEAVRFDQDTWSVSLAGAVHDAVEAHLALREPGADTGTTPPPSTAEFEPLLRGELKHGRSCPAVGAPMDEGNCDCGLKWRIRLQTEMTLRNAWEKRAYEAAAALAAAEGLTLYDILNTKAFNGSMHQAKQIADEINAKRALAEIERKQKLKPFEGGSGEEIPHTSWDRS